MSEGKGWLVSYLWMDGIKWIDVNGRGDVS